MKSPPKKPARKRVKKPVGTNLTGKKPRLSKNDIADASTMLQNGYSLSAVEERLGITPTQLNNIRENMTAMKARADVVKEFLADYWYCLATTAMGHITTEKLEQATAHQLTQIAASATEKARVLEGKPTEIVAAYEAVVKKYVIVDERDTKTLPSPEQIITAEFEKEIKDAKSH